MSESSEGPRKRKTLLYVVVVALVLLATMYAWKELSLFRLERKIERERQVERDELAMRESAVRDAAVARVSEMLELFSVPLAWAVRTEALQNDYPQIEEYMLQLIKQPSVKGCVYVGTDGMVQLATDRKLQGAEAAAIYGDLTTSDEVVLRDVDGELRLMMPVQGYDERVGSFIVVFSRDALLQPFAGSN